MEEKSSIIIYNTADGKASVSLYARDGSVWMNQNQSTELFATSKQNIGQHTANILKDRELEENSVVKNYFTTASEGKQHKSFFTHLICACSLASVYAANGEHNSNFGQIKN